MEESKQQQHLFLQMQQQHQQQMQQRQQQQQLFLMQHLQRQQQQQQQQQQAAMMTRFPNAHHLAPPGLIQNRPVNPNPILNPNVHQQQQEKKPPMMMRPPLNQMELQFAYQDAWRVCHPDFKRPFASLDDACERLLPYHVVADYEAEEDEMILHSDTTTSQTVVSRSQQWDDNIAAKVGEFAETFEKQVEAFNAITQKRKGGELRTEERLVFEQLLLAEERNACSEVKSELDREMKAHEARLRMAAMAQAGQVMGHNPLRGNAIGNYGEQQQQQQGGRYMNPDEMMMRMRGWVNSSNNNGSNGQREEKEPVENFLNDEETGQHGNWRGNGEFDLNTR